MTTFELKNGLTTEDKRLDRVPQFDSRSRAWPISAVVPAQDLRSVSWTCKPRLDQGREGACFPAGTLVELADGSHKPIEKVQTLERVRTAEGNEGTVLQTMARMHTEGLMTLKLRGHDHLRATAEHPILTRRGYVPLAELRIGDEVRLPAIARERARTLSTAKFVTDDRRPAKAGKRTYSNVYGRGGDVTEVTVTRAPDEVALTRGFGEIVGLWLAEGSSTSARLSWSFGREEETTLASRLIGLLDEELRAEAHMQVRGNGSIVVNLYGKHWRLLFERLLSLGAYEKRVPAELMDGPRDFLEGVLEGWLAGDGHHRRGRWHGVTVSHDLAMSMYRIAQVLGRAPTIRCRPPSENRHAATRRDRWDIELSDNPQRSRATLDDGGAWRKVIGFEHEEWAGYVFNMHVEGDESYIAEGIGVHNCVGFAWSHELAAYPVQVHDVSDSYAVTLYREAQLVDEWPGQSYEGTSVLAGAKVIQSRGLIDSYWWAFSVDEVLRALSRVGPVVLGIPWLDSMYSTRPDGLLDCSGRVIGGHAILARGLRLKSYLKGVKEPVVRLRNSWGPSWGTNRGDGFIRVSDLERLLKDNGEACLPQGRRR